MSRLSYHGDVPSGLADDLAYCLFLIRSWNEENAADLLEWIDQADRLAGEAGDYTQLTDAMVDMPGMPSREVLDRCNGLWAVDKQGQCLWTNNGGKLVVVPLTHFEER